MATLVSEAPLFMLLVPAKLHCLQLPRTRIPRNQACQVHSTIRWYYRRQLIHHAINPWQRSAQTPILFPTAQILYLAFQSTERYADSAPVASGETLDDVMSFMRKFHLLKVEKNSVFLPIAQGNGYYVRAPLARSVLTTW